MKEVQIRLGDPETFSIEEFARAVLLVDSGGTTQIGQARIAAGIIRAETLAVFEIDQVVVGVGVLKNPTSDARRSVEERAGFSLPTADYPLEVGYVAVERDHREHGIGRKLVLALVKGAGLRGVFATTRSHYIGRILEDAGFRNAGLPFGHGVKLYVRKPAARVT